MYICKNHYYHIWIPQKYSVFQDQFCQMRKSTAFGWWPWKAWAGRRCRSPSLPLLASKSVRADVEGLLVVDILVETWSSCRRKDPTIWNVSVQLSLWFILFASFYITLAVIATIIIVTITIAMTMITMVDVARRCASLAVSVVRITGSN